METRILIILVIICCTACTQPRVELYDSITTTLYDNNYSQTNQLLAVEITEQTKMNINGEYVNGEISHRTVKYEYVNGDTCKITTRNYKPDDSYLEKLGLRTIESILIEDSDTTEYHHWVFADEGKQQPLYKRDISKFSSLVSDIQINKNCESEYFYDDKSVNNKVIERDFNLNEVLETYIFEDISFSEASKEIPKSKNKQRVVCWMNTVHGDTTIRSSYIDNALSVIYIKYALNNKQFEETLDRNSKQEEISTQYFENGIDIKVDQIMELGLIDSIYSVRGKVIRQASIYPDSKTITTLEYDKYGNIIKEIRMSKSDSSISDEVLNEILRKTQE